MMRYKLDSNGGITLYDFDIKIYLPISYAYPSYPSYIGYIYIASAYDDFNWVKIYSTSQPRGAALNQQAQEHFPRVPAYVFSSLQIYLDLELYKSIDILTYVNTTIAPLAVNEQNVIV